METTLSKTSETTTKQEVLLIDGLFNATDAADIIDAVLDVKINYHKLKRLSITEGNSEDICEYDNDRINELLNAKKTAREYFKNVRLNGGKLRVDSKISIAIEK
jgi:hypothetical protein